MKDITYIILSTGMGGMVDTFRNSIVGNLLSLRDAYRRYICGEAMSTRQAFPSNPFKGYSLRTTI